MPARSAQDAKLLELAVAAASIEPRIDNDAYVWAALRTLTFAPGFDEWQPSFPRVA